MLTLPTADARLEPYGATGTPLAPRVPRVHLTRTAFAAAHVISDPLRERNHWDTRPAIAPAASQALEALAEGDRETYHRLLAPTVPLSREIFRAPTRFYKAGIAFLAWLNGHQSHFVMPAGFQSSRDITHYAALYRLADAAGLLAQPDPAEGRMKTLLTLHGIDQT
jgi:hypothetical protein